MSFSPTIFLKFCKSLILELANLETRILKLTVTGVENVGQARHDDD